VSDQLFFHHKLVSYALRRARISSKKTKLHINVFLEGLDEATVFEQEQKIIREYGRYIVDKEDGLWNLAGRGMHAASSFHEARKAHAEGELLMPGLPTTGRQRPGRQMRKDAEWMFQSRYGTQKRRDTDRRA
jgi:hypothetical protein